MFVRPFWEAPVELANIIDVGLRCHHVATYYAAPLLIAQRRGLIVNISFYGNAKVHDPAYYASKAGLDKLAAVYAEQADMAIARIDVSYPKYQLRQREPSTVCPICLITASISVRSQTSANLPSSTR